MDIDPRLLRAFLAVAAERSFSRAAERLACSQTTMSQRIQTLEAALEVALFTRDYHDVRLTPAGQDLLAPARRLLEAQEALIGQLPKGRLTGAVRLGIAEDYVLPMLPNLLRSLRNRLPAVEVTVETGLSRTLLHGVRAHVLDMAIVTLREALPQARTLARPRLHWVAAPGFAAETWPLALFPEGCAFRAVALPLLDRPHRIALTSASGQVIHAAVAAGLAVTVMAAGTIPPDLQGIEGPRLPRTIIQLAARPEPGPAARAVADLVAGLSSLRP